MLVSAGASYNIKNSKTHYLILALSERSAKAANGPRGGGGGGGGEGSNPKPTIKKAAWTVFFF
jgi:hypothetical protein